ncbi:MAG: peptidylprolyl isomerase [Bacteroidia bacterium]
MKFWCLFVLIAFVACKPKPFPDETVNRFEDPQLVKIYEIQDRRDMQALIPFFKAKKESHRVQAALACASIQDSIAIPYLVQMLLIDEKEMARKAAALALGQIGNSIAAESLRMAFASEVVEENQAVILESIGKCVDSTSLEFISSYEPEGMVLIKGWVYGAYRALLKRQFNNRIAEKLIQHASNADEEIQYMVAHYFFYYNRIPKEESFSLPENLKDQFTSEEAKERLALISEESKESIEFNESWKLSISETNPYKTAALIKQLDDSLNAQEARWFLSNLLRDSTSHKVIKNEAFQKIIEIEKRGSFYPEFFTDIMNYALNSGDMALQSIACYALLDTDMPYAWEAITVNKLKSIRDELVLPRQKETFIDISRAIAYSEGKKYKSEPLVYNNPIDWDYVKTIPSEQQVRITTSKGDILIQCFVDDAPASVSNFLKLVDSGFYNNKHFHRVVEHFVIQGGCPRGDGWGGLDWSQRSEFSNFQRYTTGTVGLASAGKDTEGVQWFITHNATPFLTGRYSIFARVIKGMEVVHNIEVGDKIESVKRIP